MRIPSDKSHILGFLLHDEKYIMHLCRALLILNYYNRIKTINVQYNNI